MYCRMLNVHDLGMSDVRDVLIWGVSHLTFDFHMQALYFMSFILATLRSLATHVIKNALSKIKHSTVFHVVPSVGVF